LGDHHLATRGRVGDLPETDENLADLPRLQRLAPFTQVDEQTTTPLGTDDFTDTDRIQHWVMVWRSSARCNLCKSEANPTLMRPSREIDHQGTSKMVNLSWIICLTQTKVAYTKK